MFFRKDYAAPGPGVDPDEPEKTGAARLVEILSLECGTLVKLNLLFLVSCLPVVTIPPAIFAMNQVTRMMILDRPVLCWYHYKTAFRRFWRRGYAAFAAVMAPLVFSGCGVWFYLGRAAADPTDPALDWRRPVHGRLWPPGFLPGRFPRSDIPPGLFCILREAGRRIRAHMRDPAWI